MKIIGLDLSLTSTGYARWQDGVLSCGTFQPDIEQGQGMERIKWIRQHLVNLCTGADLVAIESISMGVPGGKGGMTGKAFDRAGLWMLVAYYLWSTGVPYLKVAPLSLKKFVTGKGKGDKGVMIREVYRRFQVETDSDDVADAVGLCHVAMGLLGVFQPTMDAQKEVMAVVAKNSPEAMALCAR